MEANNINQELRKHQFQKLQRPISYIPSQKPTIDIDSQGNMWRKYLFLIKNQKQQNQLKASSSWRQTTSMPIIKTKVLQIQEKLTFPKKVSIQIQHIYKSLDQLSNLKLSQSFYLLNECLLGFNTLVYKYGSVKVIRQSCGINQKGQCRVWGEKQFYRTKIGSGTSDFLIITKQLLNLLIQITCLEDKIFVEGLNERLQNIKVNTFFGIHKEIQNYMKQNSISLPSTLFFKQVHSSKKKTSRNPSLQYRSPVKMKSYHRREKSLQRLKLLNSYNAKSDKRKSNKLEINTSGKIQNFSMKRFSHLRSESYLRKRTIMREKIENQSEALEEYGILSNENNEEFIIKEFCIQKNQVYKQYQMTVFPSFSRQKNVEISKNSLSTTQITHSKEDKSKIDGSSFQNFQEQLTKQINNINGHKLSCGRNVVSVMIQSMKVSDTILKGNYDFGGLVHREASQQESLSSHKSSNILENGDIENPNSYRNTLSLDVSRLDGKNIERLVNSIYMQENNLKNQQEYGHQVLKQNSWQTKFKCLIGDQNENLKESITCGEQKQFVCSGLKLQKLGRLGRQVGKSIIPSEKI